MLCVSIPGGNTYEDDAAQSIIDNLFTTYFETIGYLGQNGRNNSFVLKSPSEKLAFIEGLAFNNIDIVQLKNKAYELFKSEEVKYNQISTTVTILNEQLKDTTCEKVSFPIKTRDKEQTEIKIQSNLKKSETDRHKLNKIIERDQKTHQKVSVISSKIQTYTERLLTLESKIEELDVLLPDESCIEKLELITKKITKKKSQEKLDLLKQKIASKTTELKELQTLETNEINDELSNMDIWNLQSKDDCISEIEKCKNQIRDKTKSEELYKKLDSLDFDDNLIEQTEVQLEKCKNEFEELSENIRIAKLSQKVLVCPDCKSNLQLVNGCLESSEHAKTDINIEECQEKLSSVSSQRKMLQKKLEKLKIRQQKYNDVVDELEDIPDIDDDLKLLETKLQNLKLYLSENIHLDNRRKQLQHKIKNNIFSSAVIELADKLEKYKKHAKKIKVEEEIDETLDVLIDTKEELQEIVFTFKSNKNQLKDLSEEFDMLSDKIKTLEQKLPKCSAENLTKQINKYKLKIRKSF